jgi:hypothetical protein
MKYSIDRTPPAITAETMTKTATPIHLTRCRSEVKSTTDDLDRARRAWSPPGPRKARPDGRLRRNPPSPRFITADHDPPYELALSWAFWHSVLGRMRNDGPYGLSHRHVIRRLALMLTRSCVARLTLARCTPHCELQRDWLEHRDQHEEDSAWTSTRPGKA